MAKVLLAVPATTLASERCWSTAGFIINKLRSRIKTEKSKFFIKAKENRELTNSISYKEFKDFKYEESN